VEIGGSGAADEFPGRFFMNHSRSDFFHESTGFLRGRKQIFLRGLSLPVLTWRMDRARFVPIFAAVFGHRPRGLWFGFSAAVSPDTADVRDRSAVVCFTAVCSAVSGTQRAPADAVSAQGV